MDSNGEWIMQNFFKFEQDNNDWMPKLSLAPVPYQYNGLSFGAQQAPQTAPLATVSASNGLMSSGGASQPQPSELEQFLNMIGKGTTLAKKVKDAYDNWKDEGPTSTPTTNNGINGIFDPNATADPYANVNTTPPTDIMSGNNGLLRGGSADPYANVDLTPPDGLMSGNNGVLDPNASADPYANVNTGGFNPSLAGNLTFQAGQSGLIGAAGAVTLPEGTMQFADGSMMLADGTTIGADGVVSGATGGTANAGSGGLMSGTAPYLKAGAGALGFGLSAYDFANNGPSIENVGGMMSGGLAAASPWLAGAGPAAAVIALPMAWKAIMGHKHKAPDFNNEIEDITPFKKDDDGNVYMKTPGHGDVFRYNPTNNRYQAMRGTRGGEDVGMGGDNMNMPTYGGNWEDLPVYEHNGQYYLRPMASKWSDFYNVGPISAYTQAEIVPNDTLNDIYNSQMEGLRSQAEANQMWDDRFAQNDFYGI